VGPTLPTKGLELRAIGRPTRSQSLYRLRYSGSLPLDHMLRNFYLVLKLMTLFEIQTLWVGIALTSKHEFSRAGTQVLLTQVVRGVLKSVQECDWREPRLGHDNIYKIPTQLMIFLSSHLSTRCSATTENIVK
jgi:hypothetical protein